MHRNNTGRGRLFSLPWMGFLLSLLLLSSPVLADEAVPKDAAKVVSSVIITAVGDTAAPTTYAMLGPGTYTGPQQVVLACSDGWSGCDRILYCLGSNCTPTTPYSSPVPITASTDLRYYATDKAGNTEDVHTASYTIVADTAAPVTTPATPSGTYGPGSFYIYCSDGGGSGCAATYYCLGAGCTPATPYTPSCIPGAGASCPPGSSSGITISASTDLRFYSVDKSGNKEEVKTASYVIDTAPPATTANPPGGLYDAPPQVALSCDDAKGVGCSLTFYCKGENCNPTTYYQKPIPITGATVLRFYSADLGGNKEAVVTQRYLTPDTRTFTVPAMKQTIQAAIDAAFDGEMVLVSPGTYHESIDFKGRNITLKSSDGPDVTTLDGRGIGNAVVTFQSSEGRSAILDGFSITNGNNNGEGGGITINYASPTIINNKIFGNSAMWGGGIAVNFASPSIRNNVITGNSALSGYGGGISIGGAASAEILDNIITANSAESGGGLGLWAAGTPTIKGNSIRGNKAREEGGGIVMVNQADALIVQNVIADNTGRDGSALYWLTPSSNRGPYLVNNTISDSDSSTGYVVYAGGDDSKVLFANNIVAAVGRTAIYCGGSGSTTIPQLSHNVVYSRSGNAYGGSCGDQNGINGNVTADPKMRDPQGGVLGLAAGSPAIDAGDGAAPSLPANDFDGNARVVDGNADGTGTVDVGAYEFDPSRPVAEVRGVPAGFLAADTLTLTVAGTGVVSYRYALDGGALTAGDTAIATPITLSGLSNGRHFVIVLGKDAAGHEQLMSAATSATWVVNTESTPLTFSNGGAANWFMQADVSHDGIAYQSGAVTNGQASWMETTVSGPGAVHFWWKLSPIYYYSTQLTVSVDGVMEATTYGATDWQSRAVAIPPGSHTVRWTYSTSATAAGSGGAWLDEISFDQGTNADTAPPATTASPAAGILATPQQVTLSCSDNIGCKRTSYCLGVGCYPSTPYTAPITISSPTALRFYSTDAAGNGEIVKEASYTFDAAPPTTTSNLSSGSYAGPRDITLFCYDTQMGCATTYYCLGSGCTPSTPYLSPLPITASTDLRYYSVDKGGNAEAVRTASYTILPDSAPPSTVSNYSAGTYSQINLYLFCYDGSGSGCAATYYCLGTGCEPTTVFNNYVSISASTVLRYRSVDRSGNSEAVQSVTYTIDSTNPSTTPSVGGGLYSTPQSVTLSCSDGDGSGCRTTYYCQGKGCYPYQTYSGAIPITSSGYLSYYSDDAVGNREPVKTERYTITTGAPATIKVPGDSTTIQGAIDAAKNGDTIVVQPGTYVENIDFKGKAITVTAAGAAEETILDGNKAGPVVTFKSDEGPYAVLRGFTIRNGKSGNYGLGYDSGGGIFISQASPVIRENIITGNAACAGVGVYVGEGGPLIERNQIVNNIQRGCNTWYGGGGILLASATGAKLLDNTISGNKILAGNGGGIYSYSSTDLVIRGNRVVNNSSSNNGGGIALLSEKGSQVAGNLVAGNSAATGGGIYLYADFDSAGTTLVNNTISANDAATAGGLFTAGYGDPPSLINNIVEAKAGQGAIYCDSTNQQNAPQLKSNIVYAGGSPAYTGACADQDGQDGNRTTDPLLAGSAFGYYGLRPGSPAIDAGDNGAKPTDTDLAGNPRMMAGTPHGIPAIDIGAYEYDPSAFHAELTSPAAVTSATSASLTVGGDGIVSYRYALDGGAFSANDIAAATAIELNGLSSGRHAVAVIGKSSSAQQPVESATVAEWTVDLSPPATTASPASGTYYAAQTVTLSCDDGPGSGCAGTFYCLGGECTPDTPYSGPITFDTSAGLRFYSVDAFGQREEVRTASYNMVAILSGRVVDGDGKGVPAVSVTAFNAATGFPVGSASTDGGGMYRIEGLHSGSYKLSYYQSGFSERWYSGKSDRSTADAIAVSAPGTTTANDLVLQKGGSISGTVTAADTGAGLGNVAVYVFNAASGSTAGSVSTDPSGAYAIQGLMAGSYKIRYYPLPSSSGYLEQWYGGKKDLLTATPVSVAGSANSGGINVTLQKGGMISGKVTDSVTGAAVPFVTVEVRDASDDFYVTSASTDNSGRYTINGLDGSYRVLFHGSQYALQWYGGGFDKKAATTLAIPAGKNTDGIDMALVTGGTITGTVTDAATGAGIGGASVLVYSSESYSVASASASPSGAYSIGGLSTGNYKIRFAASGYEDRWSGGKDDQASATTVAVTAPNTTSGVSAALVKGGIITGRVIDKVTGAGIEDIFVETVNAATGSWAGGVYTDANGIYQITGVKSGRYKLQAFGHDGYTNRWYGGADYNSAATVDVAAPQTVNGIGFSLEKGGAITGFVTEAGTGAAIANAYVMAFVPGADGDYPPVASAFTDGYGAYTLSVLVSGEYKLRFSASGFMTEWSGDKADQDSATPVSVVAPQIARADAALAKGGSVSGTITDKKTGVGITGAYLYLIDTATGDTITGSGIWSDSNGVYTFASVPTGVYSLRVDPAYNSPYLGRWYGKEDGGLLCSGKIQVTAPNATTGVDVALETGASITGRVTDAATGAGVLGLNLTWSAASGFWNGRANVDPSGAYTFSGLQGGDYYLYFSAPGYIPSKDALHVTVAASETVNGADATLTKGGAIGGRVTEAGTGAAVAGVNILAIDAATHHQLGGGLTSQDGSYLVDGLPTGSYLLYYDSRGAFFATDTGNDNGASATAAVTASSPAAAGAVGAPAIGTAVPVMPMPFQLVPLDTPIVVTAPDAVAGVDFTVERLGSVAGRVTDAANNSPIQATVEAYDARTGARVAMAQADQSGAYTISGLPTGSYRISFSSDYYNASYVTAWYTAGDATGTASEVAVQAPGTTAGIDAALVRAGGIAGVISVNTCPAPKRVFVTAYDAAGEKPINTVVIDTDDVQTFWFGHLPEGTYKLAVQSESGGFLHQWYPNKISAAEGEAIAVKAGSVTRGIRVAMEAGGGTISVTGSADCALSSGRVKLYDWNSGSLVTEGMYNGTMYQFLGVPDGTYKLLFSASGHDRWYRAAEESGQASPVVVSGGAPVSIDLSGVCTDRSWSLIDALRSLRIAAGVDAATPEALATYDVAPVVDGVATPDGRIDLGDVMFILRKVAGY